MLTAVGVNLHRNKLKHLKGHTHTHTYPLDAKHSFWHSVSRSVLVHIGDIICQPRSDSPRH